MSNASIIKALQDQFSRFSKLGDANSDGKAISLVQTDRWLTQAKIIDNKRITTIDTGMCFNKFRLQKIEYPDFTLFIENLALLKQLDPEDMKEKLLNCGVPTDI